MHSHYHHRGRRIFFWTLVVIYISLISIIVPYSFGYRFSFERGVFVYAGSITIKSNPENITITVDEKRDAKNRNRINDAYHITGLAPGTHTINITRDGFQSIQKHLSVSSGISTELWNIILPRDTYQREALTQMQTPYFYTTPDGTLTAFSYTDNSNQTTVSLLKHDTDEKSVVAIIVDAALSVDTTRNIEWSPRADGLIVPLTRTNSSDSTEQEPQQETLILTDFKDTKTARQLLLRTLFPTATTIQSVRWAPNNDRTFYAHIDRTLVQITLPETTATAIATTLPDTKVLANDVLTYTIANDQIYYLEQRTGLIHKIKNGNSQQVTTMPVVMHPASYAQLIAYDDQRILVREHSTGTLTLIDQEQSTTPRIIATDIHGAHFSSDGTKILLWNKHEIFVHFIRNRGVQPARSAGDHISIARFSQAIDNVQWAHDYEHILYTVSGTLKVTALDARGGRSTHTLTSLMEDSIVRAHYSKRIIYFTDNAEDEIRLFSIRFPEKEGLFGN